MDLRWLTEPPLPWDAWIAWRLDESPQRLMRHALRRIAAVLVLIVVFAMAACASLPSPTPRPWSTALVSGQAPLARIVAASTPRSKQGLSGARLIGDGDQALATRIALLRRAAVSLDIQSYYIACDGSGLALLRELRAAAARGVRVRLLVDDLYTTGQDDLLAALAAHAGIEVRLFNPLPVRSGSWITRIALSLHAFSRINHRMHNKLLIADGAIAVTGGRNLGDEYFMRSTQANFIDMDVLAIGAVVPQLAELFDRFWNSEQTFPVQSLAGVGLAEHFEGLSLAAARDMLSPAQDRSGRASIASQLAAGRLRLTFANIVLLADDPAKAAGRPGRTAHEDAAAAMAMAQRHLLIVSPYFLPGDAGMAMLGRAAARGVKIHVTTNSLGATDMPLVHHSYARYRVPLLKMGARLQELGARLSREAGGLGNFGASQGRLHAKLAVIDGTRLFIGSMNMDGRSARYNTELGLLIESPELAGEVIALFQAEAQASSYQLRVVDDQHLEWLAREGGRDVTYRHEPEQDFSPIWVRWLMNWLVNEDLL